MQRWALGLTRGGWRRTRARDSLTALAVLVLRAWQIVMQARRKRAATGEAGGESRRVRLTSSEEGAEPSEVTAGYGRGACDAPHPG